jgi:hypothetical protein
MDANAFVSIRKALQGECCQRCGRETDVAALVLVDSGETPERATAVLRLCICSRCSAELLEAATGFHAMRQLEGWYTVRATAAVTRERRPGSKTS